MFFRVRRSGFCVLSAAGVYSRVTGDVWSIWVPLGSLSFANVQSARLPLHQWLLPRRLCSLSCNRAMMMQVRRRFCTALQECAPGISKFYPEVLRRGSPRVRIEACGIWSPGQINPPKSFQSSIFKLPGFRPQDLKLKSLGCCSIGCQSCHESCGACEHWQIRNVHFYASGCTCHLRMIFPNSNNLAAPTRAISDL